LFSEILKRTLALRAAVAPVHLNYFFNCI
jgi:hypothetical protein